MLNASSELLVQTHSAIIVNALKDVSGNTEVLAEIFKTSLSEIIEHNNSEKLKSLETAKPLKRVTELLTTKEAIDYLKISRMTLYNWVKKEVVIQKQIRGRVYYKLEDLEALVK